MEVRLTHHQQDMLAVEVDPDDGDDDIWQLFDIPDALYQRYMTAIVELLSAEQAIIEVTGYRRVR
jgi:hypothetical protein